MKKKSLGFLLRAREKLARRTPNSSVILTNRWRIIIPPWCVP
jgi:hypothetical protein